MRNARKEMLEADRITLEIFDAARPWEWSGSEPPEKLLLHCPAGRSTINYTPGAKHHPYCDPNLEIVERVVPSGRDAVSPFMLLEEIVERQPTPFLWWTLGRRPSADVSRLAAIALAAIWCRRTRAAVVRHAIGEIIEAKSPDAFQTITLESCHPLGFGTQKHHATMLIRDIAAIAGSDIERFLSLLCTTPTLRGYPAEATLLIGLGRDVVTRDPYLLAYRRWFMDRKERKIS